MVADFKRLSKYLDTDFPYCVSYSQLKRILQSIDYELFNKINSFYFDAQIKSDGCVWYSLDGKELGGTIAKSSGKKRGISIVNSTQHTNRQSEIIGSYDATKASEKPVISSYLKDTEIKEKKFSFDGLHTSVVNLAQIQKKESIYLAQLKGNQKKALVVCKKLQAETVALYKTDHIEQGHGRIEERQYSAYHLGTNTLNAKWKETGCCTMIVVCRGRYNTKTKKETTEESYWISNQTIDSKSFTELTNAIRNHWSVEVHHYIRDVQMGEDNMKINHKNEAVVVASFFTIATNILQKQAENITILREKLAKNWKLVADIIE